MQIDKFLFEEEDLKTTLAAILHRNSQKWIQMSTAILKNREDAEDALSEAVRRMLKRGRAFSSQEHMRMYMGRVVSNTTFELYKRRKRERRQYDNVLKGAIIRSRSESAESFRPDLIMEEEEHYSEHEGRLMILRRGLEKLSPHQYEAIRLTMLCSSGTTLRDAESASGIPRATLRYRCMKGMRALRKYMIRELNRERTDCLNLEKIRTERSSAKMQKRP
jgi:RNA polymerase sigma factor (sigma-70 family)